MEYIPTDFTLWITFRLCAMPKYGRISGYTCSAQEPLKVAQHSLLLLYGIMHVCIYIYLVES